MKTPNPLIPQGAMPGLDKNKANVRVAILTILAIHIIALGGFLIQGCKPSREEVASNDPTTNIEEFPPLPTGFGESNTLASTPEENGYLSAFPSPDGTGVDPDPVSVNDLLTNLNEELPEIPDQPVLDEPILPDEEETGSVAGLYNPNPPDTFGQTNPPPVREEETVGIPTVEHTIVSGDTLWGLSQRYGIQSKDLIEANPDVDPSRLRVGAKLIVPQPKKTPAARETTTPVAGTNVYTVQPRDNLTKIARKYETTVPALKQLNNLTSDRINVGQKLKIPQ